MSLNSGRLTCEQLGKLFMPPPTSLISKARRIAKLVARAHYYTKDLDSVRSIEEFISFHSDIMNSVPAAATRALDIGSGPTPRNPFRAAEVWGTDIRANELLNVREADLAVAAIPFSPDSFDYVTAHDFLEHIPRVIYMPQRRFPFVELMNEVWRVLRPNGLFLSSTPIYPFSEAFRDPTHVNLMTSDTFTEYFDDRRRMAAMYGFTGAFEVVDQKLHDCKLLALLRKTTAPSA